MKRYLRLAAVLLLISVILALTVTPTAFAEEYESVPYDSYAYWTTNEGTERTAVPIRQIYEPVCKADGVAMGVDVLREPTDLDTDSEGNLFVLDSENSRVVKLTPDLQAIPSGIIGDDKYDFSGAEGIFVDTHGNQDHLYICDTANNRVLIFDKNGGFIREITKENMVQTQGAVIPDDFGFQPSDLVVDSRGDIFVLCKDSTYGAVVFDQNGQFLSFYGANYVQSTILDFLGKLWDRLTQTEAKREAGLVKTPFQFNSLDIDQNDFIYTLTGSKGTQAELYSSMPGSIRRLNASGTNIYKNNSGKASDELYFTDESTDYFQEGGASRYLTAFWRLCTDDEGFVYAVDQTFGHIFIYDSQCNNIGVFGGGGKKFVQPEQIALGNFSRPVSIAVYGDYLYVLDAEDASVTSFCITDYGKQYIKAQKLTLSGNYDEAKPLWKEVLKQDKNNQLAYWGLAQAELLNDHYDAAMKYAKTGLDQVDYAVAFQQKRSEFFAANVWWIIILTVVVAVGLVALVILRRNKPKNPDNPIRFAFNTVFHPFDSFYRLKYKGAGSFWTAFVLMILYYVAMVLSDMYAGFSFSIFDPVDYNSLLTLVRTVGLIVGWTIVNWCVCILAQGKGRMKDIFMVTCYAVIPEIFACLLKLALTNILVPEESAIMTVALVCCHVLTAVILCVGIMAVHEYDFFRFLWTTVITLLGMLLIVFIIFMIYILTRELVSFVSSVVKEALYK